MNATERNLIKDTVLHVAIFAAAVACVLPAAVQDFVDHTTAHVPAAASVAFAPAVAPRA